VDDLYDATLCYTRFSGSISGVLNDVLVSGLPGLVSLPVHPQLSRSLRFSTRVLWPAALVPLVDGQGRLNRGVRGVNWPPEIYLGSNMVFWPPDFLERNIFRYTPTRCYWGCKWPMVGYYIIGKGATRNSQWLRLQFSSWHLNYITLPITVG